MKYLIVLLICAFMLTNCNYSKNKTQNSSSKNTESTKKKIKPKGYKIGDEATDFKLKNVDDKMVSFADYPKAKGFIIIFTCNHCPYSVAYEDRIIALNSKFEKKGYPVIAINPNDPKAQPKDSFELMKKRAKEKQFNFPYLFDEGQKIYPQYGATRTPHVFILNKEDGKNIVRYIGAIDNNYSNEKDVNDHYVKDAINALLRGEKIPKEITKAIGCTIKTIK